MNRNKAMAIIAVILVVSGNSVLAGLLLIDDGENIHHKGKETTSDTLQQPHIVFLINEDPSNYEAHNTIPPFADILTKKYGFNTTVLKAQGELPGIHFSTMEVLSEADLLVVFFRRAALPEDELNSIKNYLNKGNPLVAIRTANHAFSVRDIDGEIPDGHRDWWDFVPDILGSENRGYGPAELGTEVATNPDVRDHKILQDFEPPNWYSEGNIYHTAPLLDDNATILLTGTIENKVEPIAWTRITNTESRVFYTSLGYPSDFEVPQFRKLLINGMIWALEWDSK